jgi:hypothetical protein
VAASCWAFPAGTLTVSGVTDTEDNVAAVTVRVAVPVLPLKAAVMVEEPAATPVARPLPLIVATVAFDELQVTCAVISRLVPSEKLPAAANWLVTPLGMLGAVDVTEMDESVTPGGNAAESEPPPPPPHPANRRKII